MSHNLSRRNFLRVGLYGAAGAALLGPGVLRHARAAHNEPVEAVIIGRACGSRGRVAGYKNLYVVDGALIPGAAGCANPSFTIAALAERCMDALVPEVIDQRSKVLAAV